MSGASAEGNYNGNIAAERLFSYYAENIRRDPY
jgi:hypothetical protein